MNRRISTSPLLPDIRAAEGRTESANAKRLADAHGDEIRFVGPWDEFIVFNGCCWERDYLRRADAMAKSVADQLWLQCEEIENPDREIRQFCRSSSSSRGVAHMLQLLRSEPGIAIHHRELDQDDLLINLENGTLDLRTGNLRPHHRPDLMTCAAPVKFDATATCPRWEQFLQEIMDGKQELINYLQRAVGLSLSADVSEHVLFVCFGLGDNGKSVFLNTVQAMLGNYAKKASRGLLTSKSDQHPTAVAGLFGKRFVTCIETDDGQQLSEALVKELTGGDPVTARLMKQDFWTFRPRHKMWLATNHKPTIRGTDRGIWRRIKLIPFSVTIPETDKDKHLPEKLAAERSGILNWALKGFRDWSKGGLGEPAEVRHAVSEYRGEEDVLGAFLGEWCIVKPAATCQASVLYRTYKMWAEQAGERTLTQTKFGLAMTERGIERIKSGTMQYRGIGLLDDERSDLD